MAVVKIDSQAIVNQLNDIEDKDTEGIYFIVGKSSIYIKNGIDVSEATYLTSEYSTTGEVDANGYILYTKNA